jgi:hypothetical protein
MNAEESSLDSAVSTVESLWHDISGRPLGDELLEWAPDLFAFTDVLLDRSEAYRFAVSPPEGRRLAALGGLVPMRRRRSSSAAWSISGVKGRISA